MGKTVIVIGGGLSGLSVSTYLKEAGYEVTLLEATSKLGGRVFSYFDEKTDLTFDNGQHILAGWYYNTYDYLRVIGKLPHIKYREGLEVYLKNKENLYHFLASGDNPIISVAKGFVNYAPLTFMDKFKLLNLKNLIEIDVKDRLLKGKNLKWLLDYLKQTENLKKYFWLPFTYSVFNTSPEFIDAEIFYNVLSYAVEDEQALSLVIPDESLNDLFIKPFEKYSENNIRILKNSKVSKINIENNFIKNIVINDKDVLSADIIVSAVPFYNFKKLFDTTNFESIYSNYEELMSSSIISIQLVPDNMPLNFHDKYYFGMIGMLESFSQWIFFKKDSISVVISAPEHTIPDYEKYSNQEIIDIVISEIKENFLEFRNCNFIYTKLLNEKRATFLPVNNTINNRLENRTPLNNFFLAGDWTNTGLPATIESAIMSGKKCSDIIKNIG